MNKFNIVLVVPPRNDSSFYHAQCFLEVAHLLRYGLEDLGYQVIFGNGLQKDSLNIVLGYHLLWGKRLPNGYNCIIYQLEQLSEKEEWQCPFLETLRSPCIVWDFSEENIRFLAQRGIRAIYKPIGFHPKMQRVAHHPVKDVDILFYGSMNERRQRVLAELAKRFNLKSLFGAYGEQRDVWISRSKIVLAVHFYETKLYDEVRLSYLLNNKVFTVVEDSLHKKYEDFIVYADYDRLVETCEFYLQNESLRIKAAEKAYRCFSQYPEREFLKTALSQLN
jgi:hypothetical protein